MQLSFISEMLPNFCCIAAPRSGCLLLRDASNVSPAATHDSSVSSNFGERGVDASDQFLLGVYFIPKILVGVTLKF